MNPIRYNSISKLSIAAAALLLMVGCASDNTPQDMRVVFPEVNGLTYSDLSSEARSQLRAEISIDGILGATPLNSTLRMALVTRDSSYRLAPAAPTMSKLNTLARRTAMRTRSSYSEVSTRPPITEGEVNSDVSPNGSVTVTWSLT